MKPNGDAPIVVLAPMDCEHKRMVAALENVSMTVCGNYEFYHGTADGYPVTVIKCLIGMVNSAVAAALAIERLQPLCVIIEGTAGGHDPALRRGDLILGENLVELCSFYTPHRDRGQGARFEDWTYPGAEMRKNGAVRRVQTFHGDSRLLRIAETVPYPHGVRRRGTISSGDAWNKEIDRLLYSHETRGTDCEEMEGFAVAQVCAQFGVPMLDVRVISNNEMHPEEVFDETAGLLCQDYCMDLIRALIREKRSGGDFS